MGPEQYYEGILQLRNPKKEVIKKTRDLVNQRKGVYIVKEERVRGGIDFYLSSWRYLLKTGSKLQKIFGGSKKISRKLWGVSRITSKKVHRVVFLLRLPAVEVGDIVEYRGKKVKIKEFRKKISAVDVETGKKMLIKYDEI
jgi:NMD protein affecting ribosome stability and mRNA decay